MSNSTTERLCPKCGGSLDIVAEQMACTCGSHDQPARAQKPCRICGKELAGRSRLRDELGYLCKSCADVEDAKDAERDAEMMRCPECQRKLRLAGFVDYRGSLICRSCHAHHQEHDALKVGKVSLKKHDEHERKSTKRLLIIMGVIFTLLALNLLRYIL